jgi:putative PIN family toxin of toxin-antitoxin system
LRVFLGTNVLVSAFASRGICADILELVLLEHDLILGESVLSELRKALLVKVKLQRDHASEIVDFVAGEAAAVIRGALPAEANADADDALVLGEALKGQAHIFVTGDAALLRLGAVRELAIASPRSFWDTLREGPL